MRVNATVIDQVPLLKYTTSLGEAAWQCSKCHDSSPISKTAVLIQHTTHCRLLVVQWDNSIDRQQGREK
jgi:hypothetical protein